MEDVKPCPVEDKYLGDPFGYAVSKLNAMNSQADSVICAMNGKKVGRMYKGFFRDLVKNQEVENKKRKLSCYLANECELREKENDMLIHISRIPKLLITGKFGKAVQLYKKVRNEFDSHRRYLIDDITVKARDLNPEMEKDFSEIDSVKIIKDLQRLPFRLRKLFDLIARANYFEDCSMLAMVEKAMPGYLKKVKFVYLDSL